MGLQSTAQIPIFGKVDSDNEICLNAIATAYDALNDKMLTKTTGIFKNTNIATINGRFGMLRMLCRKYAPSKSIFVDRIHKIVIDNFHNKISDAQALSLMNNTCKQHNINPGILNIAAMHINQAEMIQKPPNLPNPLGDLFSMFNQQNTQIKKRRMRR